MSSPYSSWLYGQRCLTVHRVKKELAEDSDQALLPWIGTVLLQLPYPYLNGTFSSSTLP